MNDSPLMLELCAGSGTVAAAFRARGWRTITVDIEPGSDVQVDLRKWRAPPADFVWASPPCTEYSLAYPGRKALRPDRSIWLASLARIRESGARYYIIENVRGAIRYWPNHISSDGRTWFFWGFLPGLPRSLAPRLKDLRHGGRKTRAGIRARIPVDLADLVADVASGLLGWSTAACRSSD